jgi:predicted TIM-barrel fold metal-dependent hydrolase
MALVLPTLFFVSVLIFGIQQLQPSSVPAELFGADRCTFECNFPVENVGTGYATQWNPFKRIAASVSPEQKPALFAGTARRVYRLDDV